MLRANNNQFKTLRSYERVLWRWLKKRHTRVNFKSVFSAWFWFWLLIGTFFFTFQAYLLLSPLSTGSIVTELASLGIGFALALLVGLTISLSLPNKKTNWQVPRYLFFLWMLLPTLFPLLFLVGIILQQPHLIEFQTSPWRAAMEYALFGLGVMAVVVYYKKITLTQGAVTIMVFSLLFMLKTLASDSFYLAGKCPDKILDSRLAWLSNTAEELKAYRQSSNAEKFYATPMGQFVCTRTQEDLFR